jgi:glycosyltransferase involved in cell wall biosynthesis
MDTLSVVMTNYNHSRFIRESLDSILTQSFKPFEFIIIDDASTDKSPEIISEYAERSNIIQFIHNEKNLGVTHNINRLIGLAKGEYIYSIGADDKVLPGFFEKSMNFLKDHPQAGLCSTLSRLIDEKGRDRGIMPTPIISKGAGYFAPEEVSRLLMEHGSWFVGNTTIYKRKILMEVGGLRAELGPFCDGFAQQVIALRHGACFIPERLGCWRKMDAGFAESTYVDIESLTKIRKHAENLMKTTYKDIFNPQYVEQWKRGWSYMAGLYAGENFRRSSQVYQNHLQQALSLTRGRDRAFLLIHRILNASQLFFSQAYLHVRLKRLTWNKVVQGMKWFFQKLIS